MVFATALLGQNRFGTPVVTGGFGNAVLPAGTSANYPGIIRFTPNAVFPASGGPRVVVPGQRAPRYTGTGAISIPYAYPVYIGGYDNSAPDAQAQPPAQPGVTVVYPPQAPPVIVRQYDDNPEPVISTYEPRPQQEDQTSNDRYLIALKDHTIYSVVAYWVDGDTLHYFTAGNVHNQVSLTLVDRALTTRLNKESGATVNLPGGQDQDK